MKHYAKLMKSAQIKSRVRPIYPDVNNQVAWLDEIAYRHSTMLHIKETYGLSDRLNKLSESE